jgi:3-dehydroquinate dehydratase-1
MAAVSQLLASPSPSPAPLNPHNGLHRASVAHDAAHVAATAAATTSAAMDIDRDTKTPESVGAGSFGGAPQTGDRRIVVIIHGPGQESIVAVFAEVLGKPFKFASGFDHVSLEERGFVIGLSAEAAKAGIERRDQSLVVAINTHSVQLGMPPDLLLSEYCDYEFIYTDARSYRRYLTRFISFTLGQISHHEEIMTKPRTTCLCTTFPDIRAALPNLDILTVGSDVVELRIDLLREPLGDGTYANIPSLSFVAEQVMLLRQRTE